MRQLNEYYYYIAEEKYLNEGLIEWFKAFFKKLKKSQNARYNEETNKVDMYKVDIRKMKFQKEPMKFKEIDKETQEIISNEHTGFPITAQIFKNQNKYLNTKEYQFEPLLRCYFSQEKNASYYVGLILYDDKVTFLDGHKHIIALEPNLIVDNQREVNKAMIQQFADSFKSKGIKGFTCKFDLHPKLKGYLNDAGFKQSDVNKEIYVYTIK